MVPGESSCVGGSEYVWGVGVFKGELGAAEVDPHFKKNENWVVPEKYKVSQKKVSFKIQLRQGGLLDFVLRALRALRPGDPR